MKNLIIAVIITASLATGCQKNSNSLASLMASVSQDPDIAALQTLTRLVMYNVWRSGSDLHELTDGIITEEEAKSLVGKTGLWSANEVRLWFAAVNNAAYKIHQKGITNFKFGDASLASCQAAAEGAFVAKVGGVAGITALVSASITGVGAFFAGLVLTGALIQYAAAMQDCSEEYPDGIWDIHHEIDESMIIIPADFHLVIEKLISTYTT